MERTRTCHAIQRRALHLVDLENLLGDRRKDKIAPAGLGAYLARAHWSVGDHVIVAADPEIIRQIGFDPPVPCNLHASRGDDAADVMLLAHAPAELVARRYHRLVVGSGDGIFIARARAARALGVGVAIVAPLGGCASGFRRHGFPVLTFDPDSLTPGGPYDLAA